MQREEKNAEDEQLRLTETAKTEKKSAVSYEKVDADDGKAEAEPRNDSGKDDGSEKLNAQRSEMRGGAPVSIRERIADYVIERLPTELKKLVDAGAGIGELTGAWENIQPRRDNERLRQLADEKTKPLTLGSAGGAEEKNPFIAGFMRALLER